MKDITKTECYILGKNGLEKEVKRTIKKGQIFRLEHPQNKRTVRVAMIEEIKSEYFQGFKCVDLETFQIVTVEHPKLESEIFGIGYYYDPENLVSEEVLKNAISKVAEYDQKRTDQKNEVERLAKFESERIKKEFDFLPAKMENKYNPKQDYKVAKKNLSFELKKAFPNVKFSICKDGYDTMNINYIDGVTVEQVRKITDKYEGKGFNGMEDYQYSTTTAFNDHYGSVGFLFIERDFSEHIYNDASNQLFNIDYKNLEGCQRWDDYRDIRRILSKVDFSKGNYETIIMNLDFNNK